MDVRTEPNGVAVGSRNYGIDALRILSMFMVLVLHVLDSTNILNSAVSVNFVLAWVLESMALCSVNCYGLISGYVGIYAKYKYSNLVTLWLQVALYSVGATVIAFLINPAHVGGARLMLSFFPVSMNYYWYFSAYFGMYLFVPIINKVLQMLNRKQALLICTLIFVLFSVIPIAFNRDLFSFDRGYSLIWLVALYVVGGCIRKFDLLSNIKSGVLIAA